jgi:hypothetical protein
MSKNKIITAISISEQKSKAYTILNNIIIPRTELFEIRKKNNTLSQNLKNLLKQNNK